MMVKSESYLGSNQFFTDKMIILLLTSAQFIILQQFEKVGMIKVRSCNNFDVSKCDTFKSACESWNTEHCGCNTL